MSLKSNSQDDNKKEHSVLCWIIHNLQILKNFEKKLGERQHTTLRVSYITIRKFLKKLKKKYGK